MTDKQLEKFMAKKVKHCITINRGKAYVVIAADTQEEVDKQYDAFINDETREWKK